MDPDELATVNDPLDSMQDFWIYLGRSSDIPREILDEFEERHRKLWCPLGKVMLDLGMLRMKDVIRLLDLQFDEPQVRFGELAVREGLLTPEQLEEAIEHHRAHCPHPFEMLWSDERVESDPVFEALMGYARFLEGRVRAFRAQQRRLAEADAEIPA